MRDHARSHAPRWLTIALSICVLSGCGTNTPKIPAELLGGGGAASADYPSGPYGTEEGDVLSNLSFQGFRQPHLGSPSGRALETIAFSDYYDPTGTRGVKLILINTAAVWCSACRSEHEGLPARNDQYQGRGLRIVSTLFQDAAQHPATLRDLNAWVEAFASNYPMLLDPDYQLGTFARANTAPLNLIVDARTMTIEKKLLGDAESVIWPFIDASLEQP